MPKYSGADWVQKNIVQDMSDLGRSVADLLGDLYLGIYHLNPKSLRKVDWTNDVWIGVTVRDGLGTWDYNDLTRLVILCHDRMLRCQIDGLAPGYLRLAFHKRTQREGANSKRHPTIEQAVADTRHFYEQGEN